MWRDNWYEVCGVVVDVLICDGLWFMLLICVLCILSVGVFYIVILREEC